MGTLIDRVHRELTDADLQKIVNTYHLWRGEKISPSPLAGEGGGSVEEFAAHAPRPDDGISMQGNTRTASEGVANYQDIPGFCKSATTAEIAAHGFVFTPGRYVGAEEVEDDGEPFEEKITRLVAELDAQFAESARLEQTIKLNLRGLGYGE